MSFNFSFIIFVMCRKRDGLFMTDAVSDRWCCDVPTSFSDVLGLCRASSVVFGTVHFSDPSQNDRGG